MNMNVINVSYLNDFTVPYSVFFLSGETFEGPLTELSKIKV